jgi:hypothetical protein
MKNLFGWLVTFGVLAFGSWLWMLVWNYGIVALFAKYNIPTLSFAPAFGTAVLYFIIGAFVGILTYMLSVKDK